MEAVVVVRNWEYDLDKVAREVGKRLPKWNFFKFLQTASFNVKSIFASTIAEKKRGNEENDRTKVLKKIRLNHDLLYKSLKELTKLESLILIL